MRAKQYVAGLVRYLCGVQDEVINQIGLSVLSEMTCPIGALACGSPG
jgi:hypothetical protein